MWKKLLHFIWVQLNPVLYIFQYFLLGLLIECRVFFISGTIIINIQDVNKIPPVFSPPWTVTRPFYNVVLNEEQSVGSFVTILNAIDADGIIEGYSLIDTNGYFSVRNGMRKISLIFLIIISFFFNFPIIRYFGE